jgi:hypothetical protein
MKTTNDKDKILLDSISEFLERFGLKYAFRTYNKNHYDALQIFQEKGVFQIEVCQRDLSDIVYLDFNIKRFEDNHYLINFYPKDFIAITTRASLCMKDYTQKDLYNFVWSTMQLKYDIFMRGWATQSGGNKEDFYNIIKQTRAIHIETLPWAILAFRDELNFYFSPVEGEEGEKQKEE